MQIRISDQALKFFKEDMDLGSGDAVRFTSKVYGKTNIHEGVSVMVQVSQPQKVLVSETIDGITFFAEEDDAWFYNDHSLEVDYDEEEEKLLFTFVDY